jgi:hypothetical protein
VKLATARDVALALVLAWVAWALEALEALEEGFQVQATYVTLSPQLSPLYDWGLSSHCSVEPHPPP